MRISLTEMQTAIDNCRKRHVLSYAKDFRHKLFQTPAAMIREVVANNNSTPRMKNSRPSPPSSMPLPAPAKVRISLPEILPVA